MKKLTNFIKNNWILIIILLQPILDIISYFQTINVGYSLTWIIRLIFLFLIVVITFIKSEDKRKYILKMLPFLIFYICHIINLYRVNTLNIISDTKYFIMVFELPVIAIALNDYIKNKSIQLKKIEKGLVGCFLIFTVSIFLAFITNTYQNTYEQGGIIGWFSSHNTVSMILCALSPFILYYSSKKYHLFYFISSLIVFVVLYTNGTRSCYLTLLASFLVLLFNILMDKKNINRYTKLFISTLFIILSIISFKYSITSLHVEIIENENLEYKEEIDEINNNEYEEIIDKEENNVTEENNENEENEQNKKPKTKEEKLIEILKTSYLYENLLAIHGNEKVLEALNYNVPIEILADNRYYKALNANIEYAHSDFLTKLLGVGYSRIEKHGLDLENDLQAIFYYYGIIGFIIYIGFIIILLFKLLIIFIKNKKILFDNKLVILVFILLLMLVGGEYSGAFLRKSNANIYLSLYLVLLTDKVNYYLKEKN